MCCAHVVLSGKQNIALRATRRRTEANDNAGYRRKREQRGPCGTTDRAGPRSQVRRDSFDRPARKPSRTGRAAGRNCGKPEEKPRTAQRVRQGLSSYCGNWRTAKSFSKNAGGGAWCTSNKVRGETGRRKCRGRDHACQAPERRRLGHCCAGAADTGRSSTHLLH